MEESQKLRIALLVAAAGRRVTIVDRPAILREVSPQPRPPISPQTPTLGLLFAAFASSPVSQVRLLYGRRLSYREVTDSEPGA